MKRMMFVCFVTILCLSLSSCNSSDYKKAMEFQEAGDYVSALEIYESIEGYKDTSDRISECETIIDYNTATEFQETGNYASALEIYESIEGYNDTADRISVCETMITVIDEYDIAKSAIEEKNSELDAAISLAETLILENKPALDDTLTPTLETAVSEAKAAKKIVSDMPETADEITAVTDEFNAIDYSDVLSNLSAKKSALEKSIKQYALVDAPSEAYIIECLGKAPNVLDISAATEENDPNGNLNKAGGYTAHVFFSSDFVNQSKVYGNTVIEKGTDCGGSIEVYTTVEYAESRNEYLGAFDGTIWASGSHTVIGTVVVRTSDELTASQQKEMEANIISALTAIEE